MEQRFAGKEHHGVLAVWYEDSQYRVAQIKRRHFTVLLATN